MVSILLVSVNLSQSRSSELYFGFLGLLMQKQCPYKSKICSCALAQMNTSWSDVPAMSTPITPMAHRKRLTLAGTSLQPVLEKCCPSCGVQDMAPPTAADTSLRWHSPRWHRSRWAQRSTCRRHKGRKGTKWVILFAEIIFEWQNPPKEQSSFRSLIKRSR